MSHTARSREDEERWGAGVETPKNVRGVFGGWGRVHFFGSRPQPPTSRERTVDSLTKGTAQVVRADSGLYAEPLWGGYA